MASWRCVVCRECFYQRKRQPAVKLFVTIPDIAEVKINFHEEAGKTTAFARQPGTNQWMRVQVVREGK